MMQFDYILAALVGMIATGAIASPVPEAQPEAEPEAVQARAEQGAQFIGSPYLWGNRGGFGRINRFDRFNRFQDNDFIDILKRDADPEALEARAEQNKQFFGNPCGWQGCFDNDLDFFQNDFQDNDFLDIGKRDESGLQARAEQAEQAKQGEQFFYPGGGRRFNRFNNFNRFGGQWNPNRFW